MSHLPVVLIIGGNFAGLAAAKRIGDAAQVILVDPSPYFEFIPNIHELISRIKDPEDLRLDRGALLHQLGHEWIQDKVVAINGEHNQVELSDGTIIEYDACIVAMGGIGHFQGVNGAEEFSLPFKSVDDCAEIGRRFADLLHGHHPFSVVIAGGGSEGVEALGELLRSRATHLPYQIHLVEAQDRILPGLTSKLSREIQHLCSELPVEFHLGHRIQEVAENEVILENGSKIPSDLTIWTGGIMPHPILFESGLSESPNAWAAVTESLQSRHFPSVFIAGDAADLNMLDSKQAYFALESGECAAANALNMLEGKPMKAFRSLKRPYLYSFGDLSCFFVYEELAIAGAPLAALKEGIYQKSMAEMEGLGVCDVASKVVTLMGPHLLTEVKEYLPSLFRSPLDLFRNPPVRVLGWGDMKIFEYIQKGIPIRFPNE